MAVFDKIRMISGYPRSVAALKKFLGEGDRFDFFKFNAERDVVYSFDDFDQDTINLDRYALGNGAGASAVAFAIAVGEDGWIRGVTGTANDATASQSLIGPAIYYGDRNCGIEARFRIITAATEFQCEVGFTDVVPGTTAAVVNSIVTPTVNSAVVDAAVAHLRNTSSTTTFTFVTIGASITAAKTTMTMPNALALNTAITVRVQIIGNTAYCWIDGVLAASHRTQGTDYIEGGNPIAPWIYMRALNATSKSMEVDYLRVWKDRNN